MRFLARVKKFTWQKLKGKLWHRLVVSTRDTSLYPWIYRSYWHCILNKHEDGDITEDMYYAARPNPGAGIGHQMANWIAGLWFAAQFGLKFAHIPFATKKWEDFLGFGEGRITVDELKGKGFKVRRLPLFNEGNGKEVEIQKRIMRSYSGQKVVFVAEQDQFYAKQFGVQHEILDAFYNAPARKEDKLQYSKDNFNIAIHVRRGDIMADPSNPNLTMRYLSNDYFERVLVQAIGIAKMKTSKPVHIWFFSQGVPEDYPEFGRFENLHWCLDMGAQDSFLHMVYADMLITSKSSFSYKPALLNRGVKMCPQNFWHGYPDSKDWIMVDNDGKIVSQHIV